MQAAGSSPKQTPAANTGSWLRWPSWLLIVDAMTPFTLLQESSLELARSSKSQQICFRPMCTSHFRTPTVSRPAHARVSPRSVPVQQNKREEQPAPPLIVRIPFPCLPTSPSCRPTTPNTFPRSNCWRPEVAVRRTWDDRRQTQCVDTLHQGFAPAWIADRLVFHPA